MKRPTIILLLILLSGCASTTEVKVPPLVESKKTVEIDKRLLAECPDIPKLEDSSDEKVIQAVREWFKAYLTCKINKTKLNAIVRDAFNLKEKNDAE